MTDFWIHSGYHLAARNADGQLLLSDDLLRAWWRRPEVAPVDESCRAERALHAALLLEPTKPVSTDELAALQDPDARENYQLVLDWRTRLQAAPTLEAAYLDIFRAGDVTVPPVFIDQLAQMIVQCVLGESPDPLEARAAELFFRPQKVALNDGTVMLADSAVVDMHQSGGLYGDLGRLLVESNIKPRTVHLDVIGADNANLYWSRDEAHDTVLGFHYGQPGLTAFCHVIEKWVRHFFSVEVIVKPLPSIEEKNWAWHIGLDAEATAILNDLYQTKTLDADRNRRILSLFRLDFVDGSVVRSDVARRPVYMACAMTTKEQLRIKPQNLLLNLPLASIS